MNADLDAGREGGGEGVAPFTVVIYIYVSLWLKGVWTKKPSCFIYT